MQTDNLGDVQSPRNYYPQFCAPYSSYIYALPHPHCLKARMSVVLQFWKTNRREEKKTTQTVTRTCSGSQNRRTGEKHLTGRSLLEKLQLSVEVAAVGVLLPNHGGEEVE